MTRPKHILLSNDDGVDAHGLRLLARVLGENPAYRVTIVAPADQQSASSHSLTLQRPLRVLEHGDGVYAVTGTPTDCVLIAVEHILKDDPPELVISGVNHGANMGEDVTYSGTVAAAMEGAILGLPSFAVSCTSHHPQEWGGVEAFLRHELPRLLDVPLDRQALLNINIPPIAADQIRGLRVVPLGSRVYQDVITQQIDPHGNPYLWIGGNGPVWDGHPDTDGTLLAQGYVVLTPLKIDMTHRGMLEPLRALGREGRPGAGSDEEGEAAT